MMKQKEKRIKFEKIRIVSSDYKVTYHDEIRDKDGITLLDGRILESEQEIKVCKLQSYKRQLQVIVHESMHGIKWELCFNINDDESMNTLLTTGVSCFIRDNKEFIMEYMRVLNGK